jgi:hypothetical protein
MSWVKVANNTFTHLSADITDTDTTIFVDYTELLPDIDSGEHFYLTIVKDPNTLEIIKCTARDGAELTVERGQEGTTALFCPAGTRLDMRITAQTLVDMTTDTERLNAQTLTAELIKIEGIGFPVIDNAGNMRMNNGFGQIGWVYGCRAWVMKASGIDGHGNGILEAGGVTSVTKLSTGHFRITFTNPLPDANYAVLHAASREGIYAGFSSERLEARTVDYCEVYGVLADSGKYDFGLSIAVMR